MAYNQKDGKEQDSEEDIVQETQELFRDYSSKRDVWAQHAKEDK